MRRPPGVPAVIPSVFPGTGVSPTIPYPLLISPPFQKSPHPSSTRPKTYSPHSTSNRSTRATSERPSTPLPIRGRLYQTSNQNHGGDPVSQMGVCRARRAERMASEEGGRSRRQSQSCLVACMRSYCRRYQASHPSFSLFSSPLRIPFECRPGATAAKRELVGHPVPSVPEPSGRPEFPVFVARHVGQGKDGVEASGRSCAGR